MSRTDTATAATDHPSRLALDRLVVGAAPGAVGTHTASCSGCAARLERLRRQDAAFLERFPDLEALRRRRPRRAAAREQEPSGWRAGWRLALAGALAAAVLAVVVGRLLTPPPDRGGLRPKGDSVLEMAVVRDGSSFLYDADRPLRQGDVLAFRYTTRKPYLLLVSLEQAGKVNVYFTDASGQRSMRIEPGHQVKITRGVELDDYVGTELVVALLSSEPLEVAEVRAALLDQFHSLSAAGRERLEIGQLPLQGEQFTWIVHKVER